MLLLMLVLCCCCVVVVKTCCCKDLSGLLNRLVVVVKHTIFKCGSVICCHVDVVSVVAVAGFFLAFFHLRFASIALSHRSHCSAEWMETRC